MTFNKFLAGTLVLQIVIFSTLILAPNQVRPQPADAQQTNPCPAGSYNIGTKDGINPICKLEPTGCPYGDSIPLGPQCDKHKPAEPAPVEQTKPAQPSEAAQCGGK